MPMTRNLRQSLWCAASADGTYTLGSGDVEIAKGLDEAAAKHIVAMREALVEVLAAGIQTTDSTLANSLAQAAALVDTPLHDASDAVVSALVGKEVLLLRGSEQQLSGVGKLRTVRARLDRVEGDNVFATLLEDDPFAAARPSKAGEEGLWHGRSFIAGVLPTDAIPVHDGLSN